MNKFDYITQSIHDVTSVKITRSHGGTYLGFDVEIRTANKLTVNLVIFGDQRQMPELIVAEDTAPTVRPEEPK